jgi:hypothetical protein
MDKKYFFRTIGMLIFLAGVIVGMLMFGGVAWAYLEANFYGFEKMGGGHLTSINCPILITSSDTGTVSATFTNPTDNPVDFLVRADISNRSLFRMEPKMLHLDGHQKVNVEWHVSSEDIDLRNFIFVQMLNFPYTKYPFRSASCGIIVLNLPRFTGQQVFTFAMFVILAGILGGLWLWESFGKPMGGKLPEITRAMRTLGVLVLVGLLLSFLGSWLLAVLIFTISVLAIGAILGFVLAFNDETTA